VSKFTHNAISIERFLQDVMYTWMPVCIIIPLLVIFFMLNFGCKIILAVNWNHCTPSFRPPDTWRS